MKIIIDGDACPSISKIENIAKKHKIEVEIYCDIHHVINSDYSKVHIVDSGFQSVDMYIINNVSNGDIVVTQDFGVAALCLPKKAKVINPNGKIYTDNNIDMLLETRYMSQKIRMAGHRTKGPKKRTTLDEKEFLKNFEKIVCESNS
ncbi:MAG: YaiI/YqxD family protein [Clostridium sp.]|uniref:YaiI/YqxD family protein n=1 Tax=Clostridium sp. TaxID=1506 RepID=UPI003F2DC7CA